MLGDDLATYRDLLLTGAAMGLLGDHLAPAWRAAGLALRADLNGAPDELAPEVRARVREEAAAWRRARHLESGEDLRSWLEARSLDLGDFERYLIVSVTAQSGDAGRPAPQEAERSEFERALYAELACSGGWERFAAAASRLLAAASMAEGERAPEEAGRTAVDGEELAALLEAAGVDPSGAAALLPTLRHRAAALDQVSESAVSAAAVADRVAERRIDWTRFDYDRMDLPSRGAALEVLSFAAEGLPAEEIAGRAGAALVSVSHLREELEDAVAVPLERAEEGGTAGPVPDGSSHAVLWLRRRTRPSTEDEEVAARAHAELVDEALAAVAARVVSEVGPL